MDILSEPVKQSITINGAEILGEGCCLQLDPTIYPVDLVMRTAYWFTDRSYIYMTWDSSEKKLLCINFFNKENGYKPYALALEFLNSLLDQATRKQVELETHEIREIIVKKAFSEILSEKEYTITQKYGD